MKTITLTVDDFMEFVREAFKDGFEDGAGAYGQALEKADRKALPFEYPTMTITDWEDSVAYDKMVHALSVARDGDKPKW